MLAVYTRAVVSRRVLAYGYIWSRNRFQNLISKCQVLNSFGRHFCWEKNGRRSVYNWTFWAEIFWNQQNIFCIIERRDRVTFTGSISTKFVGINVKNDHFSPECMRPPPNRPFLGWGFHRLKIVWLAIVETNHGLKIRSETAFNIERLCLNPNKLYSFRLVLTGALWNTTMSYKFKRFWHQSFTKSKAVV